MTRETFHLPGGMAVYFEEKGARDGRYPPEWPMIAFAVKCMAGWACERCGHPHSPRPPWVLTVHHLDWNKHNMHTWNLAALCQRCHLRIQARIPNFYQDWPFEHSPWMARHVAEYNEWALANGKPVLSLNGIRERDYTHEWDPLSPQSTNQQGGGALRSTVSPEAVAASILGGSGAATSSKEGDPAMNVVVEKLSGRDIVALQEASTIKRHEARQATGFPPFDDGYQCPNCGHQIVPNTEEKQLELLADADRFKERSDRILRTNGEGLVETKADTESTGDLPWEKTPEETAALAEPQDPPVEAPVGAQTVDV